MTRGVGTVVVDEPDWTVVDTMVMVLSTLAELLLDDVEALVSAAWLLVLLEKVSANVLAVIVAVVVAGAVLVASGIFLLWCTDGVILSDCGDVTTPLAAIELTLPGTTESVAETLSVTFCAVELIDKDSFNEVELNPKVVGSVDMFVAVTVSVLFKGRAVEVVVVSGLFVVVPTLSTIIN